MPTEREELLLTVNLVDNASQGLAKLRQELQGLSQGQGGQATEKIKRETSELSRLSKQLGGELGNATQRLFSFKTGLGAAGAAIGLVGYEMQRQFSVIQKYAEDLRNIGIAARNIGVNPGQFRDAVRQMEKFGIDAATAASSINGLAGAVADLQRAGSPLRQELLEMAGKSAPAMEKFIEDLKNAKTIADRNEVARLAGERLYQNALRETGSEIEAANRRNALWAKIGYDARVAQAGQIKNLSKEEQRWADERDANAKKYAEQVGELGNKWDRILDIMNDPFIGPNSLFMSGLKAADALLGQVLEKLQKARVNEDKVNKELPAPEGFFQKLNPWNQRNVDRERRMMELEREEQQRIEKENTDEQKKNTDELKALNELLRDAEAAKKQYPNTGGFQPMSFGGDGFGGAQLIRASLGPSGGGGYPGGGYSDGGSTPYGSTVGPGTGPGAGQTPAGGGAAGNQGPNNVSGSDPASIRYNNPGAQYPSARAAELFGQQGYGIIGGGHKIARFLDPTHGAAANLDLFAQKYTGMPLGAAGAKWTGQHGFGVPGYDPKMIVTPEMMKDPAFAIPLMKAMAAREAGRPSPLTDDQWAAAHKLFVQGGDPSLAAKGVAGPGGAPAPDAGYVTQAQDKLAAIRKGALSPELVEQLNIAGQATGLRAVVASGGQRMHGAPGATGSHRHDQGGAGDIDLYDGNRKLDARNPEDRERMAAYVTEAVRAGATGVGHGHGYMGPSRIHIGGGKTAHWGGSGWIGDALRKGLATRMTPEQKAAARQQLIAATSGAASFDEAGFAGLADARERMAAADNRNITVTGNGKLSVDVKAPAGAQVDAAGDGLFAKTEINRQTTMEPADGGI
jgi:hypothetical protein